MRCLGGGWALTALLVVVGVMNLGWMAALTVVLAGETHRRHGASMTVMVGVALAGLGVVVLFAPDLLRSIALVSRTTVMPV